MAALQRGDTAQFPEPPVRNEYPVTIGDFTICNPPEDNPFGTGEEIYIYRKINEKLAKDAELRAAIGIDSVSNCAEARKYGEARHAEFVAALQGQPQEPEPEEIPKIPRPYDNSWEGELDSGGTCKGDSGGALVLKKQTHNLERQMIFGVHGASANSTGNCTDYGGDPIAETWTIAVYDHLALIENRLANHSIMCSDEVDSGWDYLECF